MIARLFLAFWMLVGGLYVWRMGLAEVAPKVEWHVCRALDLWNCHGWRPTEFYSRRVSQFEVLPAGRYEIAFLGDSITHGVRWGEMFPGSVNLGIGSDRIPGVLARLHAVPDAPVASLMIGINDIVRGRDTALLLDQYRLILDGLRGTVLINDVLPLASGDFGAAIDRFNAGLQRLCAGADRYVCIGTAPGLVRDGRLLHTADGTHLDGQGINLWAAHIRHSLAKIKRPPRPRSGPAS